MGTFELDRNASSRIAVLPRHIHESRRWHQDGANDQVCKHQKNHQSQGSTSSFCKTYGELAQTDGCLQRLAANCHGFSLSCARCQTAVYTPPGFVVRMRHSVRCTRCTVPVSRVGCYHARDCRGQKCTHKGPQFIHEAA